MIGLHPTSINTFYKNDLRIIRKELNKRKYIAIGEIGIDYFKNKIYAKEQIKAFEEQLHWSIEFDLPIVIHAREAFLEVFESLYKIGLNKLCGVFHSFNGNLENLKEILKYKNFMFGVNGLITHKNNEFQKHLYIVPIEKILLETDSPYLTPIPFRGRRNEPSYIIHIAQKIATIYNMPVEIIAKITTCNALNLFKI
jgi:TatD DNase family protein